MALDGAALAALRKSKVQTAAGGPPTDPAVFNAFMDSDSEAIVEHIQGNAEVSTSGTVNDGPGAGGSVTSTGTVA
jgi:hypothetical protein